MPRRRSNRPTRPSSSSSVSPARDAVCGRNSIRLARRFATTMTLSTMQVPLLDLKPQYASLKAEALAAIEKVCASQGFILGAEVTKLEKDVASYSQCKFGIGV